MLALAGLMLVMQLVGPETLRYETRLIEQGQLWRLLSAHWVHANWTHYVMNMAGFALCLALTGVTWNLWRWLWRMLLLGLVISGAFWWWQPQINWYVGFSGVLYGLYIMAAVDGLRRQPWMSLILVAFIVVKIALEQTAQVDVTSSDLIGVPVLVDAHFYGVTAAALILLLQWMLNRIQTRFTRVIDEN